MEKLLAIISIMQRSGSRRLFGQLLRGVIVIIGLTFVLATMVSALLIAALFAIYFALIRYGVEPQAAMLAIAIAAILIIMALIMMIVSRLRQLRQNPKFYSKYSPFTSRVMDTLGAFTDGLMAD